MRIKWAEYTDVVVEPESTPLLIHVWLENIQAKSELGPYVKVSSLDLSNTVADLLNSTFESIDAASLGINQQKHYFKVRAIVHCEALPAYSNQTFLVPGKPVADFVRNGALLVPGKPGAEAGSGELQIEAVFY